MKIFVRLILVSMLMIAAVPAFSGEVVQMWRCEISDGVTEERIQAQALEWLTETRKLPGGEGFNCYVYFPVAVNATGQMDLILVVTAPSFEEWGKVWDNYHGSDSAEMEMRNLEFIVCPDSTLWESFEVK